MSFIKNKNKERNTTVHGLQNFQPITQSNRTVVVPFPTEGAGLVEAGCLYQRIPGSSEFGASAGVTSIPGHRYLLKPPSYAGTNPHRGPLLHPSGRHDQRD